MKKIIKVTILMTLMGIGTLKGITGIGVGVQGGVNMANVYGDYVDSLKQSIDIENQIAPKKGIENFYEPLASHYFQGNSPQKAIEYFKLAADRAKKIFASSQALFNYDRTLEIISQTVGLNLDEYSPIKSEIYMKKGEIYHFLGENNHALASYDNALKLASEMGNTKTILLKALASVSPSNKREMFSASRNKTTAQKRLFKTIINNAVEIKSLSFEWFFFV